MVEGEAERKEQKRRRGEGEDIGYSSGGRGRGDDGRREGGGGRGRGWGRWKEDRGRKEEKRRREAVFCYRGGTASAEMPSAPLSAAPTCTAQPITHNDAYVHASKAVSEVDGGASLFIVDAARASPSFSSSHSHTRQKKTLLLRDQYRRHLLMHSHAPPLQSPHHRVMAQSVCQRLCLHSHTLHPSPSLAVTLTPLTHPHSHLLPVLPHPPYTSTRPLSPSHVSITGTPILSSLHCWLMHH